MSNLNKSNQMIQVLLIIVVSFFIPCSLFAETLTQLKEEDNCLKCHQEEEVLPDDFSQNDIHLQPGLSCTGCHGGDSSKEDMDEAMDPAAGYTGVPSKKDIPAFCGKCHSDINFMRQYQPRISVDQAKQYFTSIHGQKLIRGDESVADCASCHTGHAIMPARDPRSSIYPLNIPKTCNSCHGDTQYMQAYSIPTNQYDEFVGSVHGKMLLEERDTGSPACNDCHGNHGAMPPGITSISHVCGTCHLNNMQYFSSSIMGKVFSELELHACEECHGHHGIKKTSDDMVGIGEESTCINCHSEDDKGYKVASAIHHTLKSTVSMYDSAESRQTVVRRIGMNDVEIKFRLQDAHQNLIESRTLVHTFNPEKIREKSDESIANSTAAIQLATAEIREYDIRRKGFGVATIFITILVVALFFKIREIEKKDKPS